MQNSILHIFVYKMWTFWSYEVNEAILAQANVAQ